MGPLALAAILFLVFFGLILLAVGIAYRISQHGREKQLKGLLQVLTENIEARHIRILLKSADVRAEALRRFLGRLNITERLETRLQQSGLRWGVERLLSYMAIAAVIGVVAGLRFPLVFTGWLSSLTFACLLALLPYAYVNRARRKRLGEFEAQFPEALDFLARALRAGHALGPALGMLGKESPEPVKGEFGRVFYEHNLGESMPVVLNHLAERIPVVDVRFFVSAVLLQRETGGNLGEILTRLAQVIRERFRIRGQVKAASAHGRFTAVVLSVLPILTALGFNFIAHDYFKIMFGDSTGRALLIFAAADMVAGYFIMKRIVNIKI